jgi:DNA-binding response OmpR family regulator
MAASTRVLVVEDDASLAALLRQVLEAHGYEVYTAHQGMAAFVMLTHPEEASPHLMLLDIELPLISGISVLAFLRNTLKSCMPVIVLTGAATPEQEAQLGQLDIDMLLRKPAPLDLLLSAVESAAANAQVNGAS